MRGACQSDAEQVAQVADMPALDATDGKPDRGAQPEDADGQANDSEAVIGREGGHGYDQGVDQGGKGGGGSGLERERRSAAPPVVRGTTCRSGSRKGPRISSCVLMTKRPPKATGSLIGSPL